MGDFALVLLNPPAVFLGADHTVTKKNNCRVNTPTTESNYLLLFLFQILVVLVATVSLIHLNCQLSHEVEGLWTNSEELYQSLKVRF